MSPNVDKVKQKRNTICKGPWGLDETTFIQTFGPEAYGSRWFLEHLVTFAAQETDFATALPFLQNAQASYWRGKRISYQGKELVWPRKVVKDAIEDYKNASGPAPQRTSTRLNNRPPNLPPPHEQDDIEDDVEDGIVEDFVAPSTEDVAVQYLSTCPLLPINSPYGWPHLIDLSSLDIQDTTGLHIADMVVTVLYNHSPQTLNAFLNMSHGFTFHVEKSNGSNLQDFLIVRENETVKCGFVDDQEWTLKHRYGLQGTPLGLWTPLSVKGYTGEWLDDDAEVDSAVGIIAAGEALAFKVLESGVWTPMGAGMIHVRRSAAWRN